MVLSPPTAIAVRRAVPNIKRHGTRNALNQGGSNHTAIPIKRSGMLQKRSDTRLAILSDTRNFKIGKGERRMPNLNVTDLPDETMSALTARAYAEGYPDRLAYVRAVLNKLVTEPIIT